MTQQPLSSSTGKARAHANIGLIKYWGKRDIQLNLPAVGSISAGLQDLFTDVTVTFDAALEHDEMAIDGQPAQLREQRRLTAFLDLLRYHVDDERRARVVSRSNFPRSAGLASSAAAFAAVSLASQAALELNLDASGLSALARRGSGSAARSLFGGYVELPVGENDSCHARPIAPASHLPLSVAIPLASPGGKEVSSREGMIRSARTSPFYSAWVDAQAADLSVARQAILDRDLSRLADIVEANCLKMHAVAATARPPILYWNATTTTCMRIVRELRERGVAVFMTVDAGPNPIVFFEPSHRQVVVERLNQLGVEVRLTEVGGAPSIQPLPTGLDGDTDPSATEPPAQLP